MDARERLEKGFEDGNRYLAIIEHGFCRLDEDFICDDCGGCYEE
jgi:hypothetical protein